MDIGYPIGPSNILFPLILKSAMDVQQHRLLVCLEWSFRQCYRRPPQCRSIRGRIIWARIQVPHNLLIQTNMFNISRNEWIVRQPKKMGRSLNSGSVTGRELYDAWQRLRNGAICVSDFVGLNLELPLCCSSWAESLGEDTTDDGSTRKWVVEQR